MLNTMQVTQVLLNYLFVQDIAVLLDVFRHKYINSGVIIGCEEKNNLLMHTKFNEENIQISSKNINNGLFSVPHSYHKVGIIVNTSCEGWKNIFDSFENAFKSPFVWIFNTENVSETSEMLSLQKIELDADVTIISKTGNLFKLYEVFYTGFNQNGQYVLREIGYWDKLLHIKTQDRKDLKGLVLKSTVVIAQSQRVANKTFVRFLEEEEPDLYKVDPMHKFKLFAALRYIRDMFNVSYVFQRTSSWGYQTNGTFDGLMGALQRKDADMGGSPLFIRIDRSRAVDFAASTWQTRPCFIFRHPKHPGGYYTIYTRPLTATVWYCIIALLAVSICILGFLLKLNIIKVSGDDEDTSLSLACLCMWSALCQQGLSISRSSTSVKMVIFVICLYSVTLYQYYNATVVSTLLREPPKHIRTLQHLLKSNLKAGIEDILYNRDYLKRTTNPIAIEMYHKKVAATTPYNYFSAEKGMTLVKKGGFAFFVDSAVAYRIMRHTFTEKELCELQEVMMFVPQHLGMAVTKRSPYKEHMAYAIRRMKESGIFSRLQSVWDASRPPCVRTPDTSIFSVSLKEFSSAIIVLAAGYVTAIAVLAYEMLIWRVGRNNIEFRH